MFTIGQGHRFTAPTLPPGWWLDWSIINTRKLLIAIGLLDTFILQVTFLPFLALRLLHLLGNEPEQVGMVRCLTPPPLSCCTSCWFGLLRGIPLTQQAPPDIQVKSWSSISSYLLMNWTRTASCSPNAYPNPFPLSFREASWMGLLDHTSRVRRGGGGCFSLPG